MILRIAKGPINTNKTNDDCCLSHNKLVSSATYCDKCILFYSMRYSIKCFTDK